MPIVTPYVPRYITVHMGPPDADAENVTVSFPDYVKNVASSEIYPTWELSAIRANVLAIISFALNRVYTEFYVSRGYSFQITASTAYDQKFIKGRSIFENISQLVDEIFNHYIRRIGFVEPLAAKFCNGTTTTCDGLSQWGSQALAQQGYDSMQILRTYYGDNIELVINAPVMGIQASYPGTPLRRGSRGESVLQMQVMLNRISENYPAIPKIQPAIGFFGDGTERTVIQFQRIFNFTPNGIVDSAVWYKMVYLYVGILNLSELVSLGQTFYRINYNDAEILSVGDAGEAVRAVQYLLAVVSEFYDNIPPVTVDGVYGSATKNAVIAMQRMAGLPQTGDMDEAAWQALYRVYVGITDTVSEYSNVIPEEFLPELPPGQSTSLTQFPGRPLSLGDSDRNGGTA